MDSGMENYPQSTKHGKEAEARFSGIRRNHIIREAARHEDMILGWDRLDDEFGTVGIKAFVSVRRGEPVQDSLFPIEFVNRDGVQPGWVFKSYETQAYEISEGFFMIKRSLLASLACGWGSALTRCGCVWVPREKLIPYGKIIT